MYVTQRRYPVPAPNTGERPMAVPLNVDPALGRMVRAARLARGWTKDDLSAELGRVGDPPKALGGTKLDRLERGQRNVSAEEAWLLVEIFEELDAWELLAAARAVDPEASEPYRRATRAEAERRREHYRRIGGNRRRGDRPLKVVASPPAATAVLSDQQRGATSGYLLIPAQASGTAETVQPAQLAQVAA
jgi:transcriptional regulator with XRE-family HTH domain